MKAKKKKLNGETEIIDQTPSLISRGKFFQNIVSSASLVLQNLTEVPKRVSNKKTKTKTCAQKSRLSIFFFSISFFKLW